MEKIAIASDHGGYALKEAIKQHFTGQFEFIDLGTNSTESVDYPRYGQAMAQALADSLAPKGILVCGTGIGISIAANRFAHIRAALCTDTTMAKMTRLHNDANVLALGERITGQLVAFDIVETFMNTPYEGGRHARRVEQLNTSN